LNISILAAGAGGMYCGSCMRDNALAGALKRLGHTVTLIPLYSPMRTDAPGVSISDVYYGGVNVYLQHASRIFRHTPRVLDSIFDRPWILNAAGSFGAQTQPEKLAEFTVDVLKGEDGNATKELERLVGFLRDTVKPQVVSLPNLMFIGMARTFRHELGVPVICELTGEDLFLDAMHEQDRTQVRRIIRERVGDVTRFVATSDYYAGAMAEYLDVPRSRIDVVFNGVSDDFLTGPLAVRDAARPPTVGYLARICPEKGLGRLVDAFAVLRRMPGMSDVRLKVAGYLGAKDEKWDRALRKRIEETGLASAIEFVGEVDREEKLGFLDSIDVFSVPTVYPEAKGIYILEALARGLPVVQPEHGSFPELIRLTGGGLLTPPGDAQALAASLAELLREPQRRTQLGKAGRAVVESTFTEDRMAANMLRVYEAAMTQETADGNGENHAHRQGVSNAALVVEDVWKEYPTPTDPLVVLRGASFEVSAGETVAIVGPSGSGKSTLLNILGTLDKPTRGTIRLGDVDPFNLTEAKLAHFRSGKIGFVFQDHHLLPQCTAVENVLIAKLAAGHVKDTDASRAKELLAMVGLADRATHLPSELSGGERQRVAIARALMNGPQLLLCDEPTGNLDTKNSKAIGELLLRLAAETSAILIIVTHSPALAQMFGRQMRMTDGVLTEGAAEPEIAGLTPSSSGV
jgi:ABC-type lipoprotein export system ATPase subunit/glycosyltransferase involved in cell wall biosynthesis